MATVAVGTPLAEALSNVIQPKLVDMGWSSDSGDSALTEYVILMLVNGKSQDQIATELSNDLLGLEEGDTQALDFSKWLFEQVDVLNQQINGQAAPAPAPSDNVPAQAIPSFNDQETTAPQQQGFEASSQSFDMNLGEPDSARDGIPTGPKSMRNGRGGRGRMLNQINRSLERDDNGLHRIRDQAGGGRINSHGRGSGKGRFNQNANGRMHGGRQMGGMGMVNNQIPGGAGNLMNMNPNDQMHLMSLLEEQARMMSQFMPGFVSPAINPAFQQNDSQRSLSDRVERPRGQRPLGNFGNRPQQVDSNNIDTDMDTSPDQAQNGGQDENNTDSVCHFNLRCTRKDCPFAHQSPAAPEGTPVDISDPCSFGAACKNRKCTGRHPSPAVRSAHQAEEFCRFFPNCTNPRCHFKHPSMPLCRNGADCTTAGCKFTHLQTACKFTPCLNRSCPYKHAEGQRGVFHDKVWTADSENAHLSERRFVNDEDAPEELIKPGAGADSSSQEIMRLQCPPSRAIKELRTPLAFLSNWSRRSLHSHPQRFDAAVIGGGITGLTAAYRLSKDPSCLKVTLYEKAPRLGGWLQSESVSVDGGEAVFEYGPRTLRVANRSCFPLLDLLTELQLNDQILLTSKSSAASLNRYIYYPDRLVRLPVPNKDDSLVYNITTVLEPLLREPLFNTFIWSIITEYFKEAPQSRPLDESVSEFLSRRFSPQVANNLASSIAHGVLAGDIDRLSAKTLLGEMPNYEQSEGRVLWPFFKDMQSGKRRVLVDDLLAGHVCFKEKPTSHHDFLTKLVYGNSTLTLKKGVGQLADALVAELNKSKKVEILTSTDIKSICQNPMSSNLTVESINTSRIHNCLVATNSPLNLTRQLDSVPEKKAKKSSSTWHTLLKPCHAVTVMVVNLYYPNPNLVPARGFGYLIPKSIPFEQNPERALGVIFASESSEGQDSAPGTKLTVMMGGHWWDGWKDSDYPDSDTAVAMSQSLLKRHLGITDTPTVARAQLQRDAIPQPTVGHMERMQEFSSIIKSEYDNRITLAGAWYAMGNSGVVDSIRQAYLAASYGVGSLKPHIPMMPESNSWDLEGGIVTAPIRAIHGQVREP
ncbi:Protoporphyrinogen oxidase [Aspergillus cavernicola]|uniref:protoporphyrinogen oxidase n=1 Tax=Aspergillus cavernicola TaxID=176166 RepID=A0ABR4IJV9_9EURO